MYVATYISNTHTLCTGIRRNWWPVDKSFRSNRDSWKPNGISTSRIECKIEGGNRVRNFGLALINVDDNF